MPSFSLSLPLPFFLDGPQTAQHLHVILPYAAMHDSSSQHVLQQLQLPHLGKLLRTLTASTVDDADTDTPTPPHERAVAATWGLPRHQPAWASLTQGICETPCAWITPCHWTTGADQVRMDDPCTLQLSDDDAHALHAVLQPWFQEDGLALQVVTPYLWCVSGAALTDIATASLDRVLLRDVTSWLSKAPSARQLHRLFSEMQMLLYNHSFNVQRTARGLEAVNAFWLHGAGQLSAGELKNAQLKQTTTAVQVIDALRQSALHQDWPAWREAWEKTDAGPLANLCAHIAAGGQASLSLCGESNTRSFHTAPQSLSTKIRKLLKPQRFADLHQAL